MSQFLWLLSLLPMTAIAASGTQAVATADNVHTFMGDGFTVTTTVHSSWGGTGQGSQGHNTMFEITNTSDEEWPHWVFSMNRPLGLNEPTAWGESWQNNGLFVHQDDSETTIRNLGHQSPVRPGESVQIHTYSNTQRFFLPTDFRVRPAERRLVPIADRSVDIEEYSVWHGNNFHHAIIVQNTTTEAGRPRIIQNWEVHFDVDGGGMNLTTVPNAQVIQTTSSSAILAYIPGDGQVLHPEQVLHLSIIGTFVPDSSITNVRVYEHVGTPYGNWPPFVPPPPNGNGNGNGGNNGSNGGNGNNGGGNGNGDGNGNNGGGNGGSGTEPQPTPQPTAPRHGIEYEQSFASNLPNLIPPAINSVDVEVLDFIRGIYRITLSVDNCTLDPRATPFFFWASPYGTFEDIIDYRENYAVFTFHSNPRTSNGDVGIMVAVGDSLGQIDRRLIALKGSDEWVWCDEPVLGRVATTQMARFLVNFPPLCVGISLASF